MTRILTALLLAALSFAASAEVWQARYGVAETFNFKLYNADGTLDVDESDGGTEVSVSCNEGAETTATNDFVDEGTFYSIAVTATEMQCERIAVVVAATTTEVFFIQTSANASAMTPSYEANVGTITDGAIVAADFASGAITATVIAADAIGASEIADNAIDAGALATDAITAAKIAADAIAASEIAADAIGAAEVANAAIDAATFASGAIDATAIATDAIGAAELAADAIAASEIAADAIGASEIAANALTTAEIATGAISSDEVADNAIDAGALASDAITATKIADGAFDNATFLCTGGSFPILGVTDCGTAQSADADEFVLRGAAGFADNEAIGQTVLIAGGSAGVGQSITVADNTGSSDTLNIGAWPATTPTGTITYYLFGTAASAGGSGLDAAGVRAAVGLASANLDTQLTAIDDAVDTEVGAIKTKTDFLPSATAGSTGGVFIAGTNAATTITTALTTTFTGNLTGSVGSVASGGITATSIATDAIGAAEIADGAIDAGALATDTITAAKIAADSIGASEIAADAVGAAEVANATIDAATFASAAIDATAIATDAIGAAELATDAIGAAEIASDAGTELGTATWATTTRLLTAGTNIVLAKGTGVTGFNDLSAAQVNAEADTALSDIHLNRLFATDYDPASKPGVATALLNELIQSDAGVSQFTANALETAPSGSSITDWTADERTAIRAILGVPGSGTTPADPSAGIMDTIRDYVDTEVATLVTNMGTPSNLGSGATLAANNADIEGQTDDIGVAGAGLTATDDTVMTRLGAPAGASVSADVAAVKSDTAATLVDTAEIGVAGAGLTAVDDAMLAAIEQTARVDAAIINCTVNTANFAGSTTTVACILTDRDAGAITAASNDLEGRELLILSGAQIYEGRFINDTAWDAANSELRLTLSRALPDTLADAATAIIR